jgi:hypothetical protein
MRPLHYIVLIVTLAGCGPDLSLLDSLLAHQPRVVEVDPADGIAVSADLTVKIRFSIPIDPVTINERSFAVIPMANEMPELEDIAADVSRGDLSVLTGTYLVSDDRKDVLFQPDSKLEAGFTYGILVTTDVMTTSSVPLNQNPGEAPAPFWSTFKIRGGASDEVNDAAGGGAGEEDPDGSSTVPPPVRPAKLVINEILYDASGDETDGNLFVELAGDAQSDISGYKIVFVNGADGATTETIDIPSGSIIPDDGVFLIADSRTSAPTQTNIPGADMLDNFDPQNGPDCVELLDHHGALLDAVGYGTPLPQNAQNGIACFEGQAGPDAPAGKSVSRTDAADTNNNAADFIVLDNPTPGIL